MFAKSMKYDGVLVRDWAGDSQWRAWRADLARFAPHGYSGLASEGFWALTIYRVQRSICFARDGQSPILVCIAIIKAFYHGNAYQLTP